MPLPAIAAAALGAAATLGAGYLAYRGQRSANVASAREAQANRDFQERLSRTAHQRQVADMEAAGLNPILSARYGGASTPGGSMATQMSELGPAVSSALSARQNMAQVSLLKAQKSREKSAELLNDQHRYESSRRENVLRYEEKQKDLETRVVEAYLHGDLDAGRLWSSSAGDLVRKSELAGRGLEPLRRLIPFTSGPGVGLKLPRSMRGR